MASRIKGRARVRKLMKALPEALSQEIVVELNLAGAKLAQAIRAAAPYRTGATRAGISYRVQPRALKLQVGLISTPKGRAKLFYGRIQDLGRKAQTVTVTRFHKGGRAGWLQLIRTGKARASRKPASQTSTYTMNVRAMPGKHFITGKYPELRREVGDNLRAIYDRALAKAADGAAGAGDD